MTISSYGDAAYSLRTRSRANVWHLFLALVSFASLLPFVAIPFAQHIIPKTTSALFIVAALNFIGANFHVASTGWFYTDPVMRSHFRANPLRYLIVPGLLVPAAPRRSAFSILP